MFSNEVKTNIIKMRKSGKSLEEIHFATNVSKATLSLWLKDVVLNQRAKKRLLNRQKIGREKVSATLKNKRILREKKAQFDAKNVLSKISPLSDNQSKLVCALIYYCEGTKSDQRMAFTNSDPKLMKTFLSLLRKGFYLDESRFRAHLHLHSYHDEKTQKTFWSQIVNIPENNFIKSFRKKEGGLFKKDGYPGCLTVRYHDAALARELLEIARQYFKILA